MLKVLRHLGVSALVSFAIIFLVAIIVYDQLTLLWQLAYACMGAMISLSFVWRNSDRVGDFTKTVAVCIVLTVILRTVPGQAHCFVLGLLACVLGAVLNALRQRAIGADIPAE